MSRLTVKDVNFKNKKVLIRVDFNVPVNNGEITNDFRIVSSLPTIKKVLKDGGSVICMSHLGRPKGKVKPDFSLKPVQKRLGELLDLDVKFVDDCIGENAKKMASELNNGEILLLENLRFHKEEKKNDLIFSKTLSELADMYVNDAFGTAHRAHASNIGVAKYFDKVISGLLLEKELTYLKDKIESPKRPYTAILGGAKISGKIDTINYLFDKVDNLIIGGGMIFTFFKAMGYGIGNSLVEENKIELAKEILEKAKATDKLKFYLPEDVIVADEFKNDTNYKTISIENIPMDKIGLDIGEKSIQKFSNVIKSSKTILWNGPMGVFEMENFAKGTEKIADALAKSTKMGAISLVGGGDSAAAVKKLGYYDKISHVSTGGGASLELISGIELPAVAEISSK